MHPSGKFPGFNPTRDRAGKVLLVAMLDVLLLPLAIAMVLLEDVLWRAAQRLLRRLGRMPLLRAAHAWVAKLPAAAVLPLFLVPEVASHVGGFLGAVLLAQGKVAAAATLLVLVKGTATLAVVWIYQAASTTLLAIRWFAWMHSVVQLVRAWSLSQVVPLMEVLRRRLKGSAVLGIVVARRFRTLRLRLAALFARLRMAP